MSGSKTPPVQAERQRFREHCLRDSWLELRLVPEYGVHWTSLRVSLKGQWVDLLTPVTDRESLRTRPGGWGSYLLAPWSNRVAGSAFAFRGKVYPLRSNFSDGSAIHGDVRTRPWKVSLATETRLEASLDSRDFPDFNYPFPVGFRQCLELEGESLRIECAIENLHSDPIPVGIGFHPFFQRRLTPADRDLILVLPADEVYPAEKCIPTGPARPVEGAEDLRPLRPLGAPGLDTCYTALRGQQVRLIYPGSGLEVRMKLDRVFGHAVVFAPNDAEGRPLEFVAVEPVSHVNDGFNVLSRGGVKTGVKVLEPGEKWGGGWSLSVGDV